MKRLLLIMCLLLSAVPVWASEEIGRQEDSVGADGQVVMPIGCRRQDAAVQDTSADGDYSHVKCTGTGKLWTDANVSNVVTVNITSDVPGVASNSSGKAEDAVHSSGDTGTMFLGVIHSISTSGLGSDGDYAAIGLDLNGSVYVTVNGIIPGTSATSLGKAEGGTHVNADTGTFSLAVRHDTSTTGLGADGTYAAFGLNSLGELYTQSNTEMPAAVSLTDNTANPTVPGVAAFMMCFDGTTWDRCLPGLSDTDDNSIAFSQITSLIISENHLTDGTSWVREIAYLEDNASAGGEQLKMVGAIRRNAPGGDTSADGDYGTLITDSLNRLWVNCGAGCSAGATTPTDAFANPTTAALNMVFPVAWNGATWDRLQADGSKFLKVNCATGCAGGATTPSDAFANPTTAGLQMTFNTAWNGATWDRLQADGSKNLKVLINGAIAAGGNTIGNVNPGTATNWGVYVEDAAETAGGNLMMLGSVRRDTPTTSSNASGDNSTINTSSVGAVYSQNIAGPAGGATPCYITSAASTNATSCKGSAGTLYTVSAVNTTATLYYLRLYNTAAAPTCSSATGFIESIPVPAATTGAGYVRDVSVGDAYGTGIGFCLTGGGSSTDNTNAATGVYLSLHYN